MLGYVPCSAVLWNKFTVTNKFRKFYKFTTVGYDMLIKPAISELRISSVWIPQGYI